MAASISRDKPVAARRNRMNFRQRAVSYSYTSRRDHIVQAKKVKKILAFFPPICLVIFRFRFSPLTIGESEKFRLLENLCKGISSQGQGNPEFVFDAPSVFATDLITEILARSPAFNEDVRNWAKALLKLKTRKHRELLRLWWKDNKQSFDAMSYDRVAPISPEKHALKPEDYRWDAPARQKLGGAWINVPDNP